MTTAAELPTRLAPCTAPCECGGSAPGGGETATGLERTRYFDRQRVGPDDLSQDQLYVADRLRRHNRFLHGWGIVCGLVVTRCATPGTDSENPCTVGISAGYAIDPYGNEIVVPADLVVDLCHTDGAGSLLCPPASDPWCAPVATFPIDEPRYLALRHVEIPVKPVLGPTGCSCSDTACENSRIRDWYEVSLLEELPEHYEQPCRSTAHPCATAATCASCPQSGWVVLAALTLSREGIESFDADGERRYVVSLRGMCFDCAAPRETHGRTWAIGTKPQTLVGVASNAPDTTVTIALYRDDTPVEAVLAVRAADLVGRSVADLKKEWDTVPLLDSARPTLTGGRPLTAGMVLAHTPLRGDSVIDDAQDLEARVGTPVIELEEYVHAVAEAEAVLDQAGRNTFRTALVGDPRRLGTLDVTALTAVSRENADRLAAVGIHTLDDLYRADKVPKLTGTATATVARVRNLLFDLHRRDANV